MWTLWQFAAMVACVCVFGRIAAGKNLTVTEPAQAKFGIGLTAGSGPNEGIVEIFHDGKRGAICDSYWDIKDATVVCNQLGYPLATLASRGDRFQSSMYETYLDSVSCQGNENSLDDCYYGAWQSKACADEDTAAVICSSITEYSVRLVGGQTRFEGRVEIFHLHDDYQPMWGTICNDYWDIYDAQVVCRQLGYGNALVAVDDGDRLYGPGTGPVLLETVTCYGTESNLGRCLTPGWHIHNCGHNEDVGVMCELSEGSVLWMSPMAITFTVIGSLLGFAILVSCVWGCVSSASKKKKRRRSSRRTTTSAADTPVSYAASNPAATVVNTTGVPVGYTIPVQQFQPPPGYVVTSGNESGPGAIGLTVAPMPPPPAYSALPPVAGAAAAATAATEEKS